MKRAPTQASRRTRPLPATFRACRGPSARALTLIGGLCGLVAATGCQTGSGPRKSVGGLHVTDYSGYVEFVARDRNQEQSSKVSRNKTRSDETIFEESIKLELDGYVYHPNFVEFTAAGLFGLLQESFEDVFNGRKQSSGDDGTIVEFDVRGHFFKKKKYPGTIFARRDRRLEPRPFLSSIETTNTSYGLIWQYVSSKTPTTLQFTHNEVLLKPLNDVEQDGSQENTFLRFETEYRFTDTNILSLEYTYQKVKEEPFRLDYESNEVTVKHQLNFGPRHRHELESELNYFDQRGTFNIERFRWREVLRLEHSDTLRSWFQTELLDRTQGTLAGVAPIGERSFYVGGTLEHQAYESLLSQLFAYAQWQDFDNAADITRHGAQLSFDYRKKNPWGVLLANYRFRLEREDRTGGNQTIEVLDEQHTFRDPEPVTLVNTNINEGSIIVTSEDRTTLFQPGRDYRIRQVGDRVELERIPTGRILDGQLILVDYRFVLGGNFTLDTLQQEFGIRQRFDFGLTPYYRLLYQDQTLEPANATGALPEDITAQTIGVEFERASLRLSAEYEDYDSTVIPYVAVRLKGSYTRRFKTGANGVIKVNWSDIKRYTRDNRQTRFFTVEGRYRHPIKKGLTVEGAVLYRNEKDSLSGDDEGIDVDFSLEWLIRETEVRLTYEYGRYEDDFTNNKTSSMYVQVRRRF